MLYYLYFQLARMISPRGLAARPGLFTLLACLACAIAGAAEVGSYPNASALSGPERMLSDQSGNTVDITPTQLATFANQALAIPNCAGAGCPVVGTSASGQIQNESLDVLFQLLSSPLTINGYTRGMVADGATDNSTVITGIDTLLNNGGATMLYIPPSGSTNCYQTSTPFSITHANVILFSFGGTACIQENAANTGLPALINLHGSSTSQPSHFRTYGLDLEGNGPCDISGWNAANPIQASPAVSVACTAVSSNTNPVIRVSGNVVGGGPLGIDDAVFYDTKVRNAYGQGLSLGLNVTNSGFVNGDFYNNGNNWRVLCGGMTFGSATTTCLTNNWTTNFDVCCGGNGQFYGTFTSGSPTISNVHPWPAGLLGSNTSTITDSNGTTYIPGSTTVSSFNQAAATITMSANANANSPTNTSDLVTFTGNTMANANNFVINTRFNDLGKSAVTTAHSFNFMMLGGKCDANLSEVLLFGQASIPWNNCYYRGGPDIGGSVVGVTALHQTGEGFGLSGGVSDVAFVGDVAAYNGYCGFDLHGVGGTVSNTTMVGDVAYDNYQLPNGGAGNEQGGFCAFGSIAGLTADGLTAFDDQAVQTQKYGWQWISQVNPFNIPNVSNLRWGTNNFSGNAVSPVGGVYSGASSGPPTEGPVTSENLFINPQFAIDQQHAFASTLVSGTIYALDGWYLTTGAMANSIKAQSVTTSPPPGQTGRYEHLSVNTPFSPITANEFAYFCQNVEGPNIADLGWGAAGAADLIASMWINPTVAGYYTFFIRNGTPNTSYLQPVLLAAGWQYINLTFAGDPAGTWSTTVDTVGLQFCLDLGSGTSRQNSSYFTWIGSAANSEVVSGSNIISVQLAANTGATLDIADARLRKGDWDSPYAPPPVATQLVQAQRYLSGSFPPGTAFAANAGLAGAVSLFAPIANTATGINIQLPVQMACPAPAVTTYSPNHTSSTNWADLTTTADTPTATANPGSVGGPTNIFIEASGTFAAADQLALQWSANCQI